MKVFYNSQKRKKGRRQNHRLFLDLTMFETHTHTQSDHHCNLRDSTTKIIQIAVVDPQLSEQL